MATSEREQAKTKGPDVIHFVAPAGSISYAEVYDDDGLAGWVWITQRTDVVPRAGILLAPTTERDPSVPFQEDLGTTTLRMRHNHETAAGDLLAYLAVTRDGIGSVRVGEARTAGNFGVLRNIAAQFGM